VQDHYGIIHHCLERKGEQQVSIQELNDLLKAFDNPHHCYPQSLVDAIRLLVKERDEARRECLTFNKGEDTM